jgi:hypothetical protein
LPACALPSTTACSCAGSIVGRLNSVRSVSGCDVAGT